MSQLGYAATVHRSQGMTVGSCHVLTSSGMNRQGFYMAMTRGKNTNVAYAAEDELPDWDFEHLLDEHPVLPESSTASWPAMDRSAPPIR
ncbi:hypothetical protein [Rhodococcus koreensis]